MSEGKLTKLDVQPVSLEENTTTAIGHACVRTLWIILFKLAAAAAAAAAVARDTGPLLTPFHNVCRQPDRWAGSRGGDASCASERG